jgi:hypothetical protein
VVLPAKSRNQPVCLLIISTFFKGKLLKALK